MEKSDAVYHLTLLFGEGQAWIKILALGDFPGGPGVKNLAYNAGDVGLIPG